MTLTKKIRYLSVTILLAILLCIPGLLITEAHAGLSYTIRVGETIDIPFFYPGATSQTWYGNDSSVAVVISGQYSSVCTVMGVSPGETMIKSQVVYQEMQNLYGQNGMFTKTASDISAIRVLPADPSASSTTGRQTSEQSNQTVPSMTVGSGGKASDFDKIIDINRADESTYHDGLMPAKKDSKLGFIDKNYKVVIPFIYDASVSDYREGAMYYNQFYHGIARVQPYHPPGPGNYAYTYHDDIIIDKTGKEIINLYDPSFAIVGVQTNGKYVLITRTRRGVSYNPISSLYDMTGKALMLDASYEAIAAKYGEFEQSRPEADVWNPSERRR